MGRYRFFYLLGNKNNSNCGEITQCIDSRIVIQRPGSCCRKEFGMYLHTAIMSSTCFTTHQGNFVAFNLGKFVFQFTLFGRIRATQVISRSGFNMAKVLDYCFLIVAHDLAHNLVELHGHEHSYFTETHSEVCSGL
ncbi:hypothetical protein V1520DRAFT_3687 [Lipomyces starkeyi]|uniref:Uncharacterized protein n=1 Tax=Lipomyces starkeyi NRRL Y-11557 TaxID=675824 RepID=A0A1E3Q9I3_LIPST|nr:hypothetical protein LIPSTDRAFT_249965 [Lipomyces starkeyi NRRL Y-11557]